MARYECLQQFYTSKQWMDLRFLLILQRGARCERCGAIVADTSKLVGHHKTELTLDNVNDPSVSLNPDRIEIVCMDCHNKEHHRFSAVEHEIFLVYGPPLGGKTSAVMQMMQRGDLVVDIDTLWQAMTLCPRYDKPNNVRFNVFAVRSLLLDQIKMRYGKWYDAYIVGTYPDRFERERVAKELGAKIIYCAATKDECLTRLHNDPMRTHVVQEWERYINDWWDRYNG